MCLDSQVLTPILPAIMQINNLYSGMIPFMKIHYTFYENTCCTWVLLAVTIVTLIMSMFVHVQLQTPSSMTANVVEILHEFAQITISAAVGQKGVSSLYMHILICL